MANDEPRRAPAAAPAEPAPAEAPRVDELGPQSPERREFLVRLSLALSAVGAAVVGVPFLGFLLAPLFRKVQESWVPIGLVNQYKVGETVQVAYSDPSPLAWAGLAAQTSLWLRRDGEADFTAFAVNCTHLGCPVRWLAEANLFLCPCHGGVYYKDGSVAGGPPPRPLVQYSVRVQNDQVQVLAGESPLA